MLKSLYIHQKGTPQVKSNRGRGLMLDPGRESLVSSSGGLLLRQVAGRSGLAGNLSSGLARWRPDSARHDPGKIITDLAIGLALGGDCLADIAAVRAQPDLFGQVASDPTVSRLFHRLADDVDDVLAAIAAARQRARSRVWAIRRPIPGDPGGRVIIDPDATLVGAHSDKEGAQPTYKRGFGFHPFLVSVDHGPTGTGEMLTGMLRPGKAAANTAADHIRVTADAIAALPETERARVLVRTDSAGGSKEFLGWLTEQHLEYSVGFPATATVAEAIENMPRQAWRSAIDGDGRPREGAQVAELTGWLDYNTSHGSGRGNQWPDRMRVIARRERPHPGAQLRLTDVDGWRITCFATNTRTGRIAELEVRHRQRARAEDRIKDLKDLGLTNLPFHRFTANQVWLAIVCLAHDLLTWTQILAFSQDEHSAVNQLDQPRRWEPKRLRYRLLAVAGRIITTGRRRLLRLPRGWPWNHLIDQAWHRLQTS